MLGVKKFKCRGSPPLLAYAGKAISQPFVTRRFRVNKSFLFLALPFLIFGCNSVADLENSKVNESLKKMVGERYYLSTIAFPDGSLIQPEKTDFTFTIETQTSLVGKIICNVFRAEVTWQNDKKLIINEFAKNKNHCVKADPLLLDSKMNYRISDDRILLEPENLAWRAVFIKL